jgi:hypothetical protein
MIVTLRYILILLSRQSCLQHARVLWGCQDTVLTMTVWSLSTTHEKRFAIRWWTPACVSGNKLWRSFHTCFTKRASAFTTLLGLSASPWRKGQISNDSLIRNVKSRVLCETVQAGLWRFCARSDLTELAMCWNQALLDTLAVSSLQPPNATSQQREPVPPGKWPVPGLPKKYTRSACYTRCSRPRTQLGCFNIKWPQWPKMRYLSTEKNNGPGMVVASNNPRYCRASFGKVVRPCL